VFAEIDQRVEVMNEVRIGIAEGSLLEKKVEEAREDNGLANMEKDLIDRIQEKYFKRAKERKHYLRYPTYEALIEGVVRGEVDYAIGEITPTEARKKLGVFFTRGYQKAMPTLVAESSRKGPPGKGDTIGVLSGTVHEQVLIQLAKSEGFTILREPWMQDLRRDLQKGTVNFIFTGEEPIKPLVDLEARKQKKFVRDDSLSSKVSDYYMNHGYSSVYAIATADKFQCGKLNEQLESGVEKKRSSFYKNETYIQMQEKVCGED